MFTPDTSKSKSKALKIKILTSITVTILQDSTKKLSLLAEEERKLNKKPLCSTVRLSFRPSCQDYPGSMSCLDPPLGILCTQWTLTSVTKEKGQKPLSRLKPINVGLQIECATAQTTMLNYMFKAIVFDIIQSHFLCVDKYMPSLLQAKLMTCLVFLLHPVSLLKYFSFPWGFLAESAFEQSTL